MAWRYEMKTNCIRNEMKNALVVCTVIMFSSLSGCLNPEEGEGSIIDPAAADPCKSFSPTIRSSNDTLRILTYDIYALSDAVVNEFTNQSGYQVEFIRTDDAGGILDQMMLTKDAPQVDLIIGLDNSYVGIALGNCLLQSHQANTSSIDTSFSQDDFAVEDSLVPFDHGYVCINYDNQFVDGENVSIPTSLQNFTDEEWKGKVAFPSAVTSSPGRAFMLATTDYFEGDGEWDWWAAMKANEAIFTSGWTEAYEVHYSGGYGQWYDGYIGDAHATVSYCHSPGVEAYFGSNWTTSVALDLPRASFHQIEYAGIINGAANVDAANAFIEYLISEEVNQNMPTNNYMYGVLQGADLPLTDGYRFHSPVPDEPANLNLAELDVESLVSQWLNAIS
ncbi:MAG TPA: thiamine ABC transporter substrate-binding protein [Candidatus Poseidoniales archaeon]|nr:MAG: hypothetical protein CXX80_04380 [Euryarchaeota archaeon]HIA39701.1 thiamine ABC transporter substrate-binding protein [Candidatus Poseidoniales archaeon]HIA89645.1 thiamine ABC transporter substrate-binding protein [Candidatus Poseidoniales archaeon]HIB59765.1 thiamine ABC transporter substrate-binding protein [Candidatus Poseidoniales archaeon]HIO94450.1 thiamine ABC transporter substrate-binding protein [Candidatus Poseidoniales archaeon]